MSCGQCRISPLQSSPGSKSQPEDLWEAPGGQSPPKFMAQRWQSHAINIRGVQKSRPPRFPKGKLVPVPILSPSPIFSRVVSQQALFVALKMSLSQEGAGTWPWQCWGWPSWITTTMAAAGVTGNRDLGWSCLQTLSSAAAASPHHHPAGFGAGGQPLLGLDPPGCIPQAHSPSTSTRTEPCGCSPLLFKARRDDFSCTSTYSG